MIQQVAFKASPLETVSLGLLWYDFNTLDKSLGNTDGNELDLYAQWCITPNLIVMPLVGLYQPDKSSEKGGTQLGNNDRNLYSQLILGITF